MLSPSGSLQRGGSLQPAGSSFLPQASFQSASSSFTPAGSFRRGGVRFQPNVSGVCKAAGGGSVPPMRPPMDPPLRPPRPPARALLAPHHRRSCAQAFQYNGRVALALLPCLAVLAGYGGPPVAGILLVGGAAVYILDALRYKEGSFAAAWLTMGLANAGVLFGTLVTGEERSMLLSALIFLLSALALTLTGAAAAGRGGTRCDALQSLVPCTAPRLLAAGPC